jgi:hypothetical protein
MTALPSKGKLELDSDPAALGVLHLQSFPGRGLTDPVGSSLLRFRLSCIEASTYEASDALFTWKMSPAQPSEYLETRDVDDDECVVLSKSHS